MVVVEVPLELTVVPLSLTSSYPCHVVDLAAEISQIHSFVLGSLDIDLPCPFQKQL